jgi:twitching motility protein PilI
MTTRESLKEMQTRLAHRLQHAQSSTMVLTWLAVKAGAGNYLFPLRQSGEILSTPQLCPVPRTKPWFLGVVNVRGMLFGTIDFAHFLRHFDSSDDKPHDRSIGQASQAPSAVTLHSALEFNCAIQVDALAGLRSKDSFIKSASPPAGSAGYLGNQFFDASDCCWQEINLQALVQTPDFIDICA